MVREVTFPDIPAFELAYDLPMGVEQRGFALFLGQSQRYDQVVKTVMENDYRIRELDRTCHFLFLFDAGPGHLAGGHYDADVIRAVKNKLSLSPSARIVRRSDIAQSVFAEALSLFKKSYPFDSIAPEAVNRIFDESVAEAQQS